MLNMSWMHPEIRFRVWPISPPSILGVSLLKWYPPSMPYNAVMPMRETLVKRSTEVYSPSCDFMDLSRAYLAKLHLLNFFEVPFVAYVLGIGSVEIINQVLVFIHNLTSHYLQ